MKGLVLDAKWEPKEGYPLSPWEEKTGKAICGNSIWKHPRLELREVSMPVIGPEDVLIRVKACGICGSDVHFYETDKQDYILYPGLTKFPSILGHEFSGIIEEVGKDVQGLKPGDFVCAEEMIWCGKCNPCRNGFPNHCENLEEIGFTINGAFSEYISIGAKYCWKLNDLVKVYPDEDKVFEAGACVEPSCVAYNGIFTRAGGFKPGAYIAVYGAGPIGLSAIALSKCAGAALVIAFEISERRIKMAKEMGADYVFNPQQLDKEGSSISQKILEITEGNGVDMHVEAAGAPHLVLPEAEKCLAINGKVVQIGRAAQKVPVYLETYQVRRAQIFGAQGHSGHGNFPYVIRLIASGRYDPTKMITAHFSLDQAVEALKKATLREDAKIIIKI